MTQIFLNNFKSNLASAILAADTAIALQPGAGLPAWSAGDWMWVTLAQNGSETSWEIVKATQWSTDSFDVVERAQQGTVAADWPAWSKVQNRATAADFGSAAAVWGSITGTVTNQTDLTTYLSSNYAALGHDHSGVYSPVGHDHSGVYSPVGHDHSGVYQPLDAQLTSLSALDFTGNQYFVPQVNTAEDGFQLVQLAPVAFSGEYTDLSNTPVRWIPPAVAEAVTSGVWTPSNLATHYGLLPDASPTTITGIYADILDPPEGEILIITNRTPTPGRNVILQHTDPGVAAETSIVLSTGEDRVLRPGERVMLWWQQGYWRDFVMYATAVGGAGAVQLNDGFGGFSGSSGLISEDGQWLVSQGASSGFQVKDALGDEQGWLSGDGTFGCYSDAWVGGGLTVDGVLSLVSAPFTGNSLKYLRVNVGETDWELATITPTAPGGSDTHVQFNDGGVFAGDAGLTWNKISKYLTITGVVAAAYADGLVLATDQVATSGNQKWSNGLRFIGSRFQTTAAAARVVDVRVYLKPVQNSGDWFNDNLVFEGSHNGGAYSELFRYDGASAKWYVGSAGYGGTGLTIGDWNYSIGIGALSLTFPNDGSNIVALRNNKYYESYQAVAATSTDGLVLATSATATSGNQKYSPRVRLRGSYFSGSAKTTDFIIENQPTASGGLLSISHSDDGAAYVQRVTISPSGSVISLRAAYNTIMFGGSGNEGLGSTGTMVYIAPPGGFDGGKGFGSTSSNDLVIGLTAADTFLNRNAAADIRQGGAASATPIAQTSSVQNGSGTNIVGALRYYVGSLATGNAASGGHAFQVGDPGGSGSTLQTAATKMLIEASLITGYVPYTGQINVRAQNIASSASITPSPDTDDLVKVTALAADATFNNPTPVTYLKDGQKLLIRITDDGGSRNLTWDTQYRSVGATLPATTTAGKTTYLGFLWNSVNNKWDLMSLATTA